MYSNFHIFIFQTIVYCRVDTGMRYKYDNDLKLSPVNVKELIQFHTNMYLCTCVKINDKYLIVNCKLSFPYQESLSEGEIDFLIMVSFLGS